MHRLDLTSLSEPLTLAQYLELLLFLVVPTFVFIMGVSQYYHAMNYLCLLIHDLRNQLDVIIELTGLLADGSQQASFNRPKRHSLSTQTPPTTTLMIQIRNRLIDLVNPNLLVLRTNRHLRANGHRGSCDLDDRLANQEFARQLMCLHRIDLDAYVGLLEQLQINYWLLMENIKGQNRSLTMWLLFTYLFNYSFALVGIYVFQAFKEFVAIIFIFIVGPVVTVNVLIMLASNVHARARKFERKLWSLIASQTEFGDERVSHLRSLMRQQFEFIGAGGGLALKMFGRINVTYVQIIQFLLGTLSLLVFSYRNRI